MPERGRRREQSWVSPTTKLALWRERLATMEAEGLDAWPIGYGQTLEIDGVERLVGVLEEEVAFGSAAAYARWKEER